MTGVGERGAAVSQCSSSCWHQSHSFLLPSLTIQTKVRNIELLMWSKTRQFLKFCQRQLDTPRASFKNHEIRKEKCFSWLVFWHHWFHERYNKFYGTNPQDYSRLSTSWEFKMIWMHLASELSVKFLAISSWIFFSSNECHPRFLVVYVLLWGISNFQRRRSRENSSNITNLCIFITNNFIIEFDNHEKKTL